MSGFLENNIYAAIVIFYLAIINIISVIAALYDKYTAVKHKWRVSENTLLILSALGGGAAMLLTMKAIRHKTKHLKFMAGIPVIIILQVILIFMLHRCFL